MPSSLWFPSSKEPVAKKLGTNALNPKPVPCKTYWGSDCGLPQSVFLVCLRDLSNRAAQDVAMTAKRENAWWLLPGAVALVTLAILDLLHGDLSGAAVDVGTGVAFYVAGTVAYLARPANRAAWFLLLMATLLALGKALGSALSAAAAAHSPIAGTWGGVVLTNAAGWAVMAAGISVLATFPDGIYQRRYERRVVRGLPLAFLPVQLLQLLGSARLSVSQFGWVPIEAASPVYVHGLDPLGAFASAVLAGNNVGVLPGLVLLILRYRRFGPEQRRQIKWPLYAVALSGISFVSVSLGSGPPPIPYWMASLQYVATLGVLPAGLAMGIVVHRSLDIDQVIRRSVVYGVLWACIAAAFVLVAAAFGIAVGQRVPLVLAVVLTIVATLVFQPARRRLERLADQLVFGPRLSGYELNGKLALGLNPPRPPRTLRAPWWLLSKAALELAGCACSSTGRIPSRSQQQESALRRRLAPSFRRPSYKAARSSA